ncbi:HTH domain-containing protein [Runella sp. MFBS21]|uniref:HTH domain-containing protein n=1 Tax=Runella sp. MFBS21 TaxID=3034018 RepID=UPI0023F7B516|nr:HTH domain-containing protein [Runella sp. MFBS21]MDF7818372.1 HTH domain-containing protein [Runella sp. MFBS21]
MYEFYWGGIEVHFAAGRMPEKEKKSSVKIIELITENNQITIPEIAQILQRSTRAVEKQIHKLKEANQLQRIGADKGGYWKVLNSTS